MALHKRKRRGLDVVVKPVQEPCHCDAYDFPHRPGGGKCSGYPICAHGEFAEGHPDYSEDYPCRSCHDEYWSDMLWDQERDRQMEEEAKLNDR